MLCFLMRRSGKRCKHNCYAYGTALLAAEKLSIKCKNLSIEAEQYNNILAFSSEGNIILGVSTINNHIVETMLKDDGGRCRTVWLCLLPYSEYDRPVCRMDLKYISKYRIAHIEDWHCEIEDMGYGSVFMTHIITYLKLAGYRYLTGYICPADFGHEDKLRHFYKKFGFTITDYSDRRALKLHL